jgi:hydrogenase expression/formation protein HypD
MRYIDEYRDPELVRGLLRRIAERASGLAQDVTIMEVCGSHTTAIGRYGLRRLLPKNIRLVSGPGCPVCVTAASEIDRALWFAARPGVVFTSFGDLLRVPGRDGGSLEKLRAAGARIEVVGSALEAVAKAQEARDSQVIFFGIGFETTSPTAAAALLTAERLRLDNFFLYSCHKLMPPVMQLLLQSAELAIDGFLCPGHVSTIIGAAAYEPIVAAGRAAVIAGFEPADILAAVLLLLEQLAKKDQEVVCAYPRAVKPEGNRRARAILAEVFTPAPALWRGLGEISDSGLALGERFAPLDAERHFAPPRFPEATDPACRCGEVLRGRLRPDQCALFGRACTPARPHGPCMVSQEGSCAAFYRYPEEGGEL